MRDQRFAALSDTRRQELLLTLFHAESNPPLDVRSERFDEATRTQLHHIHLPKLSAAGYVTWEIPDGTVRRGPQFHTLEPLLALLEDESAAHV